MFTEPRSHHSPRHPIRLITLAVLLVVVNAGAALAALTRPPEVAAQISLRAPLEFVTGALWTLSFGLLAVRLWQRRSSARRLFGWALIAWIGYSLVRLFVFARADYDQGRLPPLFLAGLVACALILVFVVRPMHISAIHTETQKNEQREN